MSSLALTAENWEPCVHITAGMVRANGKAQAKAVRASLGDLPLHTQNRCTKTDVLHTCYSRLIHGVQWPYKAVCMNHHACNIEFVKKKH